MLSLRTEERGALARSDRSYRRGMVLGFTVAELFLILLFLMLAALAALANYTVQETTRLNNLLSAAEERAARGDAISEQLVAEGILDEDLKKLVDDAKSARATGVPINELIPLVALGKEASRISLSMRINPLELLALLERSVGAFAPGALPGVLAAAAQVADNGDDLRRKGEAGQAVLDAARKAGVDPATLLDAARTLATSQEGQRAPEVANALAGIGQRVTEEAAKAGIAPETLIAAAAAVAGAVPNGKAADFAQAVERAANAPERERLADAVEAAAKQAGVPPAVLAGIIAELGAFGARAQLPIPLSATLDLGLGLQGLAAILGLPAADILPLAQLGLGVSRLAEEHDVKPEDVLGAVTAMVRDAPPGTLPIPAVDGNARTVDRQAAQILNQQGQIAQLSRQIQLSRTGNALPSCWATVDGRPESIFEVTYTAQGVLVKDRRLEHRAQERDDLEPVLHDVSFDVPLPATKFSSQLEPLFKWSARQVPECRFYVILFACGTGLNRDQVNAVNAFFYPDSTIRSRECAPQ